MKQHTYHIKGMHCRSCEIVLENNISKIPGVKSVNVHHKKGIANIEFTDDRVSDELIGKAVNEAGYTLGKAEHLPLLARSLEEYSEIVMSVAVLVVLYLAAKITGATELFGAKFSSAPTYPIVFLIGLTAGVSTCMAVVGGLVAGLSASYAEKHQYASRWERFQPNIYFNIGRLVSYAVLGGAIGAFGSVINLSTGTTGFLVAGAGLVMLYIGLKLTGISPKLSNSSITLPKGISRALGVTNEQGEYSHGGAIMAGALTFFLPCGFTQAMQLYAITTGSFVSGSIIMFLFALGTAPGLLGIGAITSYLKGTAARIFFRFVGVLVVALGLFNIANGYRLTGITIPSPFLSSSQQGVGQAMPVPIVDGAQIVNMEQLVNGYKPNAFTIKKGIPVKWIINSQSSYTCAASIRVPGANIAQPLTLGENIITFTPNAVGPLRFTCGMGMYSGTFTVVE